MDLWKIGGVGEVSASGLAGQKALFFASVKKGFWTWQSRHFIWKGVLSVRRFIMA